MEKLHNNIILEDDFNKEWADPENVPYLKNPPKVINVNVGRQLFVDDFLIEKTSLTPEYHKAKKYQDNPVFKPETPWETDTNSMACPFSGGVWYDEDEEIFKMWYGASWHKNLAYAISKDGINWERPNLGIVGDTNIILPYEDYNPDFIYDRGAKYLRPDSTSVWIDYNAPKEERYKLFLRNPGAKHNGIIGTSSDGINFENLKMTGIVQDRTTIFYNPFRNKWVASVRWLVDYYNRVRYYYETHDFSNGMNWTEEQITPWLRVDEKDLQPTNVVYNGPHHIPQIYNIDCIAYESIMLGMFEIFYGPENGDCEKVGLPKITELIPMYSRDGYHFSRPSREPFIRADKDNESSWERGYVQSVTGGVIDCGDHIRIYYTAFKGNEKKLENNWTTNGMYDNGATGFATLRKDGFVSLNGNGELLTRILTFNGKKDMYVNIDGEIIAEIITEEGKVIAKSNKFIGDSVKAKLEFNGFDISSLNDKIFRIKFTVNGKFYSFGFADEKGDFNGYHGAGKYCK